MQKIEIGMEDAWFKDADAADIFGGRANVETVEGANLVIRIDDEILDLVELTVARFHDEEGWVWNTPNAYGYARGLDAAKAAASSQGWHESMLRLREEVPAEVMAPLEKIARTAGATVRKHRAAE